MVVYPSCGAIYAQREQAWLASVGVRVWCDPLPSISAFEDAMAQGTRRSKTTGVARASRRAWVLCAAAGVAAYLCASQGLTQYAGAALLPVVLGLVVGLVASDPLQGSIVAGTVALLGTLLLPPAGRSILPSQLPTAVVTAALAALTGAVPSLVVKRVQPSWGKGATVALSLLAAGLMIVGLWSPLLSHGIPPDGFADVPRAAVEYRPVPHEFTADLNLYRRVFYLLHEGKPYYPSFAQAWSELASKPAPISAPFGFRMPTYFWLWSLLPPSGFSMIVAFLAFASVGIAAAWSIGLQLVGVRLAPLAALAVAAFASAVSTSPALLYVDMPAMSIALAGIALYLRSCSVRRVTSLWVAVGIMVIAALTREILVYLLVLGLTASLAEPKGERIARGLPWTAGLVAFGVGYAAHAHAAAPYLAKSLSAARWFNGGFAYAWDGLTRFSGGFATGVAGLGLLVALGLVGAWAARRVAGDAFSLFAVLAITLPIGAWLFVGNPAHDSGSRALVNYWGILTIPTALSFWPAAALLLSVREPTRARATPRTSDPRPSPLGRRSPAGRG